MTADLQSAPLPSTVYTSILLAQAKGIEPFTRSFGDSVATLVHALVYVRKVRIELT